MLAQDRTIPGCFACGTYSTSFTEGRRLRSPDGKFPAKETGRALLSDFSRIISLEPD